MKLVKDIDETGSAESVKPNAVATPPLEAKFCR